NLLLPRPLFTDAGVSSVTENLGSINNRGIEFELRTLNFARGGFEWRTDLNLSRLNNEITSLLPGQDTLLSSNWFVGHPRGVYYVQRYAGVNPADGRPMYYDRNGNITYNPQSRDLNVEGDVVPDFFGGISNRFSYKGLALDVFFQFNVGQETFLQNEGFFLFDPSRLDNVDRRLLERSWKQPGDIAEYPIMVSSTNLPGASNFYITSSTRLMEDASYLRLKTLTLSYDLPRALLRLSRMRQAQLYASAWNLMTWTAYDGIDPELVGTSAAPYPQTRQYTLGVTLSF
ncbi:MAG TPA: SusC/RagA family TonB-linked outer membrane protein, partial [Rhodothermales bacterium]|nr:SusC/RagA family TonB-linked outer membrane protein [Rhodothermales bacterium]